jgi:hypothetical protein
LATWTFKATTSLQALSCSRCREAACGIVYSQRDGIVKRAQALEPSGRPGLLSWSMIFSENRYPLFGIML